ncbi:hypothetical protein ACO0LL_29585 [Undibacterium sp. TC4M20W]|uniref:hypothetical protein n=1 Tax=Undibacterium sp. TC4M20W TaxID=3413052 RepID=UPI003BF2B00B
MLWRAYEVKDDTQYRLHLCHASNGRRYFRLVEINSEEDLHHPEGVIFSTKIVLNELLRARCFESIAKSTELESGKKYFVDAHGTWLTESECNQLYSRISFDEIRWDTDLAPLFTSR